MKIKIKLDDPLALPKKKHQSDAGFDLVNIGEDIKLHTGDSEVIHTGVYTEIPEGYVGLVFPRSSTGKNGLVLLNTVGVIDSHYRGEIMVMAKNVKVNTILHIGHLERFAQLVIVPVFLPELEVVDELSDTQRGAGGFGSTGRGFNE